MTAIRVGIQIQQQHATYQQIRQAWRAVDAEIAARARPGPGGLPQALHGDPHPRNVLILAGRVVWNDFEDCCRGPAAWDLAVLRSTTGLDGAAAVHAYGADPQDPDLVPFVRGRELQRAVWSTVGARTPEDVDRVHGLLDALLDPLPAPQPGRTTARMPTAGWGS